LVVGCAIAACNGSAENDDDDDDDSGGTSGAAGISGSGGVIGTGGSSSGSWSCVSICENLTACPENAYPTCLADCTDTQAMADENGCSIEFDVAFGCIASIDLCPLPLDACEAELSSLNTCVSFGHPGGCAPSGTGPATGDCVAVCERLNACGLGMSDCAVDCPATASMVASAGCSVEYGKYLGCMSTCTNVCRTADFECTIELDALLDCIP
jgi:hypothetical protein